MKAFIVLLAVTFVFGDSVDDLCPSVNGVYPVYLPSEDCSKFYECSNGIARLQNCPPGLEYNAKLHVCDYPEVAGCERNRDNTTATTSSDVFNGTQSTEVPITDQSSEVTNGTQATEEPSTKPSDDSNEGQSSEESSSSEDSNESGGDDDEAIRKACESAEFFLIPYPNDCSKYISCSQGKPYVMPCPAGLNFSPLLRICLPRDQVQCLAD